MQALINALQGNGVMTITILRVDMVEALQAVKNLKITRLFAMLLGPELATKAASRLGFEVK